MNREQAQGAIKGAMVCGIISTVITLIATLVALRGRYALGAVDITVWNFVDVVLLLGLSVGLYFKNRACAVVLFLYFVFSKYLQWSAEIRVSHINPVGLVMGLVFLFFYFRGILGTFAYWKLKKAEEGLEPPPMP